MTAAAEKPLINLMINNLERWRPKHDNDEDIKSAVIDTLSVLSIYLDTDHTMKKLLDQLSRHTWYLLRTQIEILATHLEMNLQDVNGVDATKTIGTIDSYVRRKRQPAELTL